MKRVLLPIMTVAVASASILFTACSSTDNKDELYAEIRDILDEGEAYKTHEKQKDKYVLPNASLETSRALYLPIGGALTDAMKESVGNDYLAQLSRKANPKVNKDLAKVWSSLKMNFSSSWDGVSLKAKNDYISEIDEKKKKKEDVGLVEGMKYDYYKAEAELTKNLRSKVKGSNDMVFNGDEGLKGARAKMIDMIPNADSLSDAELENRLVEEVIKKVRLEEAIAYSRQSEEGAQKIIDEANKEFADFDKVRADQKKKSTVAVWYGLDSAKKSFVYTDYLKKKEAVEQKMTEEKNKAWDEVVEADRKVAAFSTYWVAVIGRRLYPVVIPLVPLPDPIGGILTATTPVADEALGLVTDKLAESDKWLPTSLVMELDKYPSMQKQFGAEASLDDILLKLGEDATVSALLDMDKVAKIEKLAKTDYSNPFAALSVGADILDLLPVVKTLGVSLQEDIDAEDYGMVPLHMIEALGNSSGKDFLNMLNAELDPYRYANDIALKRIEYTNKALDWLSGDRLETLMLDISGE